MMEISITIQSRSSFTNHLQKLPKQKVKKTPKIGLNCSMLLIVPNLEIPYMTDCKPKAAPLSLQIK